MNYLIVDDEPIAHKIIEKFASEIPYLKKVGNCFNAIDAVPILQSHRVDLIFLDINMPRLKGFDFLKSLQNPPQIIVISAHKEFALEGYEYNITDYLLKPFNFERFFKAVQKAMDQVSSPVADPGADQSIFIKDEKQHHKVSLSAIRYIEASGNYSIVYLDHSRIMTSMKISDFEKLLPSHQFIRVHRSFLVSTAFISLVKSTEIHLGPTVIPVGRVFKSRLDQILR